VTLADSVRPEARALIDEWRNAGVDVWIASGDHDKVVQHVANLAGIAPDRALSRQTPESKLELVRRLREEGRHVAMVGDGVNDAAALREADTGIAMFGGAEINALAADVQLGRSGLGSIGELRHIADDALGAVHRNLALSAVYNVIALTAASAGFVSPLVAAIAMPLSSIAVVVSSLSQGARRKNVAESSDARVANPVMAGGSR
jgi:P-type E1-E2 ATPase